MHWRLKGGVQSRHTQRDARMGRASGRRACFSGGWVCGARWAMGDVAALGVAPRAARQSPCVGQKGLALGQASVRICGALLLELVGARSCCAAAARVVPSPQTRARRARKQRGGKRALASAALPSSLDGPPAPSSHAVKRGKDTHICPGKLVSARAMYT